MPGFLLLDDAKDEATRKLKDFAKEKIDQLQLVGQGLTSLQQGAQQQVQQVGQDVAQQASSRLQSFANEQMDQAQQIQQQVRDQAKAAQDASARLQSFAVDKIDSLAPKPGVAPSPDDQANYIRQAARARNIDPETAVSVARSEGLNTYVGDNGSSFGPFQLHYGGVAEGGNAVPGLGDEFTRRTGLDARDPSTWQQQVDFTLDQVRQGGWGPWHGAAAIGVTGRQGVGAPATSALDQTRAAVSQALPAVSQFGDKQLSSAEAYAACGPAAAVRFAQLYGRNPTLREATDIARTLGWSEGQGMAGLASESKLFDQLGIPHRMVGADWQALATEAQSGNPVTISTPGHYFTADSYDPKSGAFHVGSSGTDLRRGSEWMTPQQMESVMGQLQGGMAADNPNVPAPSPLASGNVSVPGSGMGQGTGGTGNRFGDQVGEAAQQGLKFLTGGGAKALDDTLKSIGPSITGRQPTDINQTRADIGSAIANAPVENLPIPLGGGATLGSVPGGKEVGRVGAQIAGGLIGAPSVMQQMETLSGLTQKYGLDTSQMTPEDRDAYSNSIMAVGGMSGGLANIKGISGTTKMFPGTSEWKNRPNQPSRVPEVGTPGVPMYHVLTGTNPRASTDIVQPGEGFRPIRNRGFRYLADTPGGASAGNMGGGPTKRTLVVDAEPDIRIAQDIVKPDPNTRAVPVAEYDAARQHFDDTRDQVRNDPNLSHLDRQLTLEGIDKIEQWAIRHRNPFGFTNTAGESMVEFGGDPTIPGWSAVERQEIHRGMDALGFDAIRVDDEAGTSLAVRNLQKIRARQPFEGTTTAGQRNEVFYSGGLPFDEGPDTGYGYNPKFDSGQNLLGRGYYMTDDPRLASGTRTQAGGGVAEPGYGQTRSVPRLGDAEWTEFRQLQNEVQLWQNRLDEIDAHPYGVIPGEREAVTAHRNEANDRFAEWWNAHKKGEGSTPSTRKIMVPELSDLPSPRTRYEAPQAAVGPDYFSATERGKQVFKHFDDLYQEQVASNYDAQLQHDAADAASVYMALEKKFNDTGAFPDYEDTYEYRKLQEKHQALYDQINAAPSGDQATLRTLWEQLDDLDNLIRDKAYDWENLPKEVKTPAKPGGRNKVLPESPNFHVFVTDAPMKQIDLDAVKDAAGQRALQVKDETGVWDSSLYDKLDRIQRGQDEIPTAIPGEKPTGLDLWTYLGEQLKPNTPEVKPGRVHIDRADAANELLSDAGFDGILYQGGLRRPLRDEITGDPILHRALNVFPNAVHRVTNAFSMRARGETPIGFATGLAGAAAAGGAIYNAVKQGGFQAPDLSGALGIDERQQQIEANRPTSQDIPSDIGAALTTPGFGPSQGTLGDVYGAGGKAIADNVINQAKQLGWQPDPEQEASARRLLQQASLGTGITTLLTAGGGTVAQMLARGGISLLTQMAGGEAGRQAARVLGGDETAQGLAELGGSLAGGFAGSGALRALERNPATARFLADEVGGGPLPRLGLRRPGERPTPTGMAVPEPGYTPGSPEALAEDLLRSKGTPRPNLTQSEIQSLPGMAGARVTDLNEVRDAVRAGTPAARWYSDVVQQIRQDTGQTINPREAAVLMGATGADAGVTANYHAMLTIFRAIRKANPDLTGLEDLATKDIEALPWFQKMMTDYVKPEAPYTTSSMIARILKGYRTGVVPIPSGAKISSYTQNFIHALNDLYDPYTTQDVWQGRLFGARYVPDPTKPGATGTLKRPLAGLMADPNSPNVGQRDTTYRSMHALTNWIARENDMNPREAQAAGWIIMRMLWNDPQIGRDLALGKTTLRQALTLGQQRGLFSPSALKNTLADINTPPAAGDTTSFAYKLDQLRQKIRAEGDVIDRPPPASATALEDINLRFPAVAAESAGMRAGDIPRPVGSPEAAELGGLARGTAPVLRVPGRVATDTQGRIPGVTLEHTVQSVGDNDYVRLVAGGDDAATALGRQIGADEFVVGDPDVTRTVGYAIGEVDDAVRQQMADALRQNGLPVFEAGKELRVPTYTGDNARNIYTTLDHVINAYQTPNTATGRYVGRRVSLRSGTGPLPLAEAAQGAPGVPPVGELPAGAEYGRVNPLFAARTATTAAGAFAGYQSDPNAPPEQRLARAAAGAAAGNIGGGLALAPFNRSAIDQAVLQSLRRGGISAGPGAMRAPTTAVGVATDLSKQGMLTNPLTHAANAVGNTIELLRQPAALALGGQTDEAAASVIAMAKAFPEAFSNAASTLVRGQQPGTLGTEAQTLGRSQQVYRLLGAMDMFTRTLGEYQGMAGTGLSLLRRAGLEPGTAAADAYLASHADELYNAGARAGATGVFGTERVAGGRGTLPMLDRWMSSFSKEKERMLGSSNRIEQGVGALLDSQLPFTGVPTRILQVGLNRLPVINQTTGVARAIRAAARGDTFAAQKAIGETALETMAQLKIGQEIANGNITGPNDPEHPSSVNLGGTWVPLRQLGGYGLPMSLMAAFAEGWQKQGNDVQNPDQRRAMLERFSAGLNATGKPLWDAVPGSQFIDLLSGIGEGGLTRGAEKSAQGLMNRVLAPSLVKTIEDATDPVAREIARRGPESLWQQPLSRWPGLARWLPEKIDPATGKPQTRPRQFGVPGIVAGLSGEEAPRNRLREEITSLAKQGYNLNQPTQYPESISLQGSEIPLSPEEQRKVTEITGKMLGDFTTRLDSADYKNSSPDRKARLVQAYLDATSRARAAALRDVIGSSQLYERWRRGQSVAGRLTDEARSLPPIEEFAGAR